jgi:hypothetical protein
VGTIHDRTTKDAFGKIWSSNLVRQISTVELKHRITSLPEEKYEVMT